MFNTNTTGLFFYFLFLLQLNRAFAQAFPGLESAAQAIREANFQRADQSLELPYIPYKGNPYVGEKEYKDGMERLTRGDTVGALYKLTKSLQADPGEVKAATARGNIKYSLGDYDGAIEDFSTALLADRRDSRLFYKRAMAKRGANDMEGALVDFISCLRVEPQFAKAIYYKALTYLDIGKIEQGCLSLAEAGNAGITSAFELAKSKCK